MPQWLEDLCERITARLQTIRGIEAVALGGSWARGTARPDSDVDFGIYYYPDAAFSPEELAAAV